MSGSGRTSTGNNRFRPDRDYDTFPSKKSRSSTQSRRIFIGHVSKNTVVAEIRKEVEKFGNVVDVFDAGVYTSRKTQNNLKKFYVKFQNHEDAAKCLNRFCTVNIFGRPFIRVRVWEGAEITESKINQRRSTTPIESPTRSLPFLGPNGSFSGPELERIENDRKKGYIKVQEALQISNLEKLLLQARQDKNYYKKKVTPLEHALANRNEHINHLEIELNSHQSLKRNQQTPEATDPVTMIKSAQPKPVSVSVMKVSGLDNPNGKDDNEKISNKQPTDCFLLTSDSKSDGTISNIEIPVETPRTGLNNLPILQELDSVDKLQPTTTNSSKNCSDIFAIRPAVRSPSKSSVESSSQTFQVSLEPVESKHTYASMKRAGIVKNQVIDMLNETAEENNLKIVEIKRLRSLINSNNITHVESNIVDHSKCDKKRRKLTQEIISLNETLDMKQKEHAKLLDEKYKIEIENNKEKHEQVERERNLQNKLLDFENKLRRHGIREGQNRALQLNSNVKNEAAHVTREQGLKVEVFE